MKRWIAIAFLTFAWLRGGFVAMAWRERAEAAEARAAEAEAWAEVVEQEAALRVAEAVR